jgi:hypothetical protein
MWNLNGDDIQRAKEQLKGRRAALQARYESELKQLEADIADLERFERFAVKFLADFKGQDAPSGTVAEPNLMIENVVDEVVGEESGASEADVVVASAEPASSPAHSAAQKNSSRWRMRLNTGEAAP